MENIKLSRKDYRIFFLKSLFFLGFVWLGFILALAGFFYASIAWVFWGITAIWLIRKIIQNKTYLKISLEMLFASVFFALVAILFVSFSTPTVFSGRDQGSISEASIRLAENHKLEFSTPASTEFFKIYGPGRALNFPGFYYTKSGELTTQFPLVYIVWLALFYAPFGLVGFAIANCILLFIFFLSFFLLARFFLKTFPAIPIILFSISSFAFMWFSKFTLSENMALPLLWLAILSLLIFLKNPQGLTWAVFLASISLICFTRIEGFAFLAVSILIIIFSKTARDYINSKIKLKLFLPLIFFFIIFAVNFFKDTSFYIEIAKAILPKITNPGTLLVGDAEDTTLPTFFMTKIFYLYGMLGFFLFGALGAALQLKEKDFYKLIPFFIVAPTFIYLLDSHISADHPWMLRRFLFSLLPLAILYSGFLIEYLFEKSQTKKYGFTKIISFGIFLILFIGNLPSFSKYLTFSENKTLLAQTQTFSNQFSENDLILADRETTSDGWSMIAGPMNFLFKKNAAYFFNFNDLGKIDLKKFGRVYLIAPNEKVSSYIKSDKSGRLMQKNNYSFTSSKLDLMQNDRVSKTILPEKKELSVNGKIFKVVK